MANRDLQLLESIKEYIKEEVPLFLEEVNIKEDRLLPHPLDKDIVEKLNYFYIREEDDDYRIFYYVKNKRNMEADY